MTEIERKRIVLPKSILVIEDTFKHIEDARKYFWGIPEAEVMFASTYSAAADIMFDYVDTGGARRERTKGSIDGVISDIYFPLSTNQQWNQPEPIGVRVALELSQLGIPFVLNTAGLHHGRKYEWINGLARDQGWALIDGKLDFAKGDVYENDADEKNWEVAYKTLEARMK